MSGVFVPGFISVEDYNEYLAALTSSAGPNNASPLLLVSSLLAHSGPCLLFGYTVTNTNAATRFFQLFDLAAVPANGTVPVTSIQLLTNGDREVSYLPARSMFEGIVIANSSTIGSLTLGAADSIIDVQYLPMS